MGPSITEVFIKNWMVFLKGLGGTLEFAFVAVFFGTILGAFIALMHRSKIKVVSGIAIVYATIIRGTPLLVQMYIAYFFLPMVIPALNNIDKIYTVIFALVLNSSAYVSEIIRSGINAVDKGQMEAARSLGMSYSHAMRKIIMPQAIKNILPALANEYITMIKETSLAGTFSLYELMYTRTILANQFLMYQPLFIIAAIYLLCTVVLSALVRKLERRLAVSD